MFVKIVRTSVYNEMLQKLSDLEMQKNVYENMHKQDVEEKEKRNKEILKKVEEVEKVLETAKAKDLKSKLKDLFSFLKKS